MRAKVEDCKYNAGVGCGEKLGCEKCGWNPEVIEKRKSGWRNGLRDEAEGELYERCDADRPEGRR